MWGFFLPVMLYRFVKILMRAALGLFYKEILRHRLEHIPANGPALLIANHPSSLMDAALLGISLKRPIHFFARGDIFSNSLVAKILLALHMYPVHHHNGGRETLGLNDAAFDKAIDLLLKGELVLFFPEGTSHTEYRLWKFRKGAFRIALRTVQQKPTIELPIVPIGLNYSHPTKIFSTVWMQTGTPIITNTYLPLYNSQPSAALKQLTEKGFLAVQQLVTDADLASAKSLHQLLDTWRNSLHFMPGKYPDPIVHELEISKAFGANTPEQMANINAYQEALENAKTCDAAVTAANATKLSTTPLVIGFPAACIGWALNGIPILLARYIADRKVKRIDFYSWVLVTSAALLFVAWFTAFAILSFILLPAWKATALLFIAVSTGQYSWNYFAYYREWKTQQQGLQLPASNLTALTLAQKKVLDIIVSPA